MEKPPASLWGELRSLLHAPAPKRNFRCLYHLVGGGGKALDEDALDYIRALLRHWPVHEKQLRLQCPDDFPATAGQTALLSMAAEVILSPKDEDEDRLLEVIVRLCRPPLGPLVTGLELCYCEAAPDSHLSWLAQSVERMTGLRSVDISFREWHEAHLFGAKFVRAFLDHLPMQAPLSEVRIDGACLLDSGVEALLAHPSLCGRKIRCLHLTNVGMTTRGARALAAWPNGAHLKELWLYPQGAVGLRTKQFRSSVPAAAIHESEAGQLAYLAYSYDYLNQLDLDSHAAKALSESSHLPSEIREAWGQLYSEFLDVE